MNQGYDIVGVQLSNGKNMTIDEFKRSRGEIDYSFSHLKNAVDEIRNSSLVKHCVYIDIFNPNLSVIVTFDKADSYIRFELQGDGILTYSNNKERKIIVDWETADINTLIPEYCELRATERTSSVTVPSKVMHEMFIDLRLVLGQYRNKCELEKSNNS